MRVKRTDGTQFDAKDGYILAEGESFLVPISMMDAASHFVDSAGNPSGCRPGFLFRDQGSETDLDKAHREYREGISERWKSDRWSKPSGNLSTVDKSNQSTGDPYEEYNNRIANAWKSK